MSGSGGGGSGANGDRTTTLSQQRQGDLTKLNGALRHLADANEHERVNALGIFLREIGKLDPRDLKLTLASASDRPLRDEVRESMRAFNDAMKKGESLEVKELKTEIAYLKGKLVQAHNFAAMIAEITKGVKGDDC